MVRLFYQAFGMSPIQYHQLMRAHAARHMIQFTNEPLTVIAENLGFSSIHAFSPFFKTIEGKNPSYYRRKS
ncbi:helix-turn-helix domain-containing protein [Paenibacillus sp. 23TSA30-6]|uniref:helix-turn-helix domain-containing protein n=1 Tax=Paenibacillus sp. 23TSA30-6 TaxID=2546104 RepID=UPI002355752F|nr:helix-turn-helix domain-containing protein [Paenibacillus sp. 23TSA30-6]MBE0339687.1 AraC family transcriptional regulator [Paenibacillus sp. 23TSA30-6]